MLARRSLLETPSFVCRSCVRQYRSQLRRTYATSPSSTNSSTSNIYDVVCVGGGPAGLSLLTALRSNPVTSHLRVALVEAQDLAPVESFEQLLPPGHFSNRCSSLTPASGRFLDSVGAWRHMCRERVQPYREMQVWDGLTGARIEFELPSSSPSGAAAAGADGAIAYMAENLNITSGLLKRLRELGGVDVFDKTKVSNIGLGAETEELDLGEWPVVELSSGESLTARLLVGADGANSPVRAFAGIQSRGWDYGRHGVVATLQLDPAAVAIPGVETAYQRFLPTGPVAMLPLPDSRASLVWSTTPDRAALLKSLSAADFAACVNAAFRLSPVDLTYLHTIPSGQEEELAWRTQHTTPSSSPLPSPVVSVQPGSVASFPLKLRHADTYIGERVALVGDAAHTVHPLAGQGLNAGQGDVQSLAGVVARAVSCGQDIGTTLALEPYNAERYAANHVVLGVCDKLHKLYAVESGPLVPLRSVGLRAVNAMGFLKNFLMEQASGNGAKLL